MASRDHVLTTDCSSATPTMTRLNLISARRSEACRASTACLSSRGTLSASTLVAASSRKPQAYCQRWRRKYSRTSERGRRSGSFDNDHVSVPHSPQDRDISGDPSDRVDRARRANLPFAARGGFPPENAQRPARWPEGDFAGLHQVARVGCKTAGQRYLEENLFTPQPRLGRDGKDCCNPAGRLVVVELRGEKNVAAADHDIHHRGAHADAALMRRWRSVSGSARGSVRSR